jgi:hypothetical protein
VAVPVSVAAFAVVVLDASGDLGEAHRVPSAGASGRVRDPVASGLGLAGWPFGDQPAFRQGAIGCAREVAPCRTYPQRGEPARITALRLPGVLSGPCRRVKYLLGPLRPSAID